jgi:hypothetical protein
MPLGQLFESALFTGFHGKLLWYTARNWANTELSLIPPRSGFDLQPEGAMT